MTLLHPKGPIRKERYASALGEGDSHSGKGSSITMKWSRYDDRYKEKNDFRLPADPYCIGDIDSSMLVAFNAFTQGLRIWAYLEACSSTNAKDAPVCSTTKSTIG